MTPIEVRYHHTNNRSCHYYKPADDERGSFVPSRGASLLVNRTMVAEQFRGVDPERARLTLTVEAPEMTKIELRYHHTDNQGYVYYKPADDERGSSATGPSLLVNRTLVAEQFRGVDPQRAKLTLTVENG